jgi:hypothetical protein
MSNTKETENKIAKLLARKLDVKFKSEPFPHQEWGKPDKWAQLSPNKYLLLEVEEGQTHPDTNVLKVWPYLEDHPKHRIFLIQAFFRKRRSRNSSRARLGEWIGGKLKQLFSKQFYYRKITIGENNKIINDQGSLKEEFRKFCTKK